MSQHVRVLDCQLHQLCTSYAWNTMGLRKPISWHSLQENQILSPGQDTHAAHRPKMGHSVVQGQSCYENNMHWTRTSWQGRWI
jgi:hypothetical protein